MRFDFAQSFLKHAAKVYCFFKLSRFVIVHTANFLKTCGEYIW